MINVKMQPTESQKLAPKITVIGVGGGGGNAVNNMISSGQEGCEFLVCNTDSQALEGSLCENRIQLGAAVTGGLGAGSKPEIGKAAAEESLEEVLGYLEGCNMVFVTAGMGGGTGTGAAPVIAKACRERGILTVGVVTKPFHFEGTHRMKMAETGIDEMQDYVDTLIVIPNQNLFRVANEKTTFADAFRMADGVLQSGVRGVTDLMVRPGLVNLDFADIRTAMLEMGKAMMGTGEADGEKRAIEAAEAAINNPLLDDVSMKGANGVIINVTGGYDMTLFEADEACNRIRDEVDPNANIIFGATFDEGLEGVMRVSIVATGIEREEASARRSSSGGGVAGKPGFKRAQPNNEAESSQASSAQVEPEKAAETPKASAPSGNLSFTASRNVQGITAPPSLSSGISSGLSAPASQAASGTDMFEQREFAQSEDGQSLPENTALRGTRYMNSFIPPRPAESSDISVSSGSAYSITAPVKVPSAAPTQAPAPAPAAQTPTAASAGSSLQLNPPKIPTPETRKTTPSLLERITGSVQQHLDHLSGKDEQQPVRQRTAPKPNAGGPLTAPQNPAQGSLNIDSPAARPEKSEDDLDIPAFLRRQAN